MTEGALIQCLLGMQCNEFVIIAADKTNVSSIVILNNDFDKLVELSDCLVMGVNGQPGDTAQLTQYIHKNMELYKMKNKYALKTTSAVHFIRRILCDALRSNSPVLINSLIGGFDERGNSLLYAMDFLGACVKVNYAAHGFGGFLSLSVLDKYYSPELNIDEAFGVLKLCVREVHERLVFNLPNFGVKAISKYGVITLPDITPAML